MYLTIVNEISSPIRYNGYAIQSFVSKVQPDDGQVKWLKHVIDKLYIT